MTINHGLLEIAYTEDDILKIKDMLSPSKYKDNLLENLNYPKKQKYIMSSLFSAVLRYRAAAEKTLNCYSDFLTASGAYQEGAKMAKDIYDAKLSECNDQANKLLKALLGLQFQKSFTKQELIEQYHYPTVSDGDLHEVMTDSL